MNIGEWLQLGSDFLKGVQQGINVNNDPWTAVLTKLLGNNQTNNVSNIATNIGADSLSQFKLSNALGNAFPTKSLNMYTGPSSTYQGFNPATAGGAANAAQQAQQGSLATMVGNAGAIAGGLWNIYSGVHGMRQNNRRFKSDMASASLQRSIAQEQMDIMRKEYNRLNRQRAAISKAYGG